MATPTLRAALLRPEAYPHRPAGPITCVETHISLVMFAGDRVYKVKKPVDMGFLDYTTLAARKHFCEEEVRLNRRLAPRVYRGVVEVTQDRGGAIRIGGDGEVVDYAVEMVRLPAADMLDARLERGEIDNEPLAALADRLVAFHAGCATGPGVDEHGAPAEIARQAAENLARLAAFAAAPGTVAPAGVRVLSPALLDHLRHWLEAALAAHSATMERRVREGRIREGHGDLHAGNICFTRGEIEIYDCIEFTPRYRCRDVAAEIAFLAMDLEFRGYRGFSRFVVRRYAERAGDGDLPEMTRLYKPHLAVVRAMVAGIRAAGEASAPEATDAARIEAMRYVHLAAAYTMPPALVLMCGLPASGKSRAARALARAPEAAVLRSDVIRKELAGVPPTARAAAPPGGGIYTSAFTDRTYATLLARAQEELRSGRTVVVDAMFATARRRRPFLRAAEDAGCPLLVVELRCSEAETGRRMTARARDREEVSDANLDVYLEARKHFEPPDEIPARRRVLWIGEIEDEELVGRYLEQRLEEGGRDQGVKG